MDILVLSDTHGEIRKAIEICKDQPADIIIHLGDYAKDAVAIQKEIGKPITYVKGNMDTGFSGKELDILTTEKGNILLVHGHREGVKGHLQNLLYKAEELNCFAVFFGHTHISFNYQIGDIHLLNPGSLSRPKDGSRGTYGMVYITREIFEPSIIYI